MPSTYARYRFGLELLPPFPPAAALRVRNLT